MLCIAKSTANDGQRRWPTIDVYCQLDLGHEGKHEFRTLCARYHWSDKDHEAEMRNA